MLSQAYNIIIDHGISAPVHGREMFYGLNSTDKRFIFKLMVKGEKRQALQKHPICITDSYHDYIVDEILY